MTVFLSHGGPNIYSSAAASDRLLVGTTDGLVLLTRAGGSMGWENGGRWLEGRHISSLLMAPTPEVVFAGTHNDGLYVSEDGGATWDRRDRGIAQRNIYCLSFQQRNGELRLYAGTEPSYLYVSSDRGESWDELSSIRQLPSTQDWFFLEPPFESHVKSIAFVHHSPDTIYVGIEQGAILKSTDGGKRWVELKGLYLDPHRLAIPKSRPETVFVTGGKGIYRSDDGGQTWEHLTAISERLGYPDALIIWPGGFELVAGSTDGEVFASQDGETWSVIASGLAPVSKGRHHLNLVERLPRPPEAVLQRMQ